MTPNTALPSHRSAVEYALDAKSRMESAGFDETDQDKWPVWARLLVIVGLSALFWAGIISAIMALFG
jgi:hypothetical protein